MTTFENTGAGGFERGFKPETFEEVKDSYAVIPPDILGDMTTHKKKQLEKLLLEQASREMEALRLYEPMAIQRDFHECRVLKRIIRGSNRSGKTTAAIIEVCRAVTGQDPYNKYPKTNGRAVLVGKDETHIAEVFINKMLKHGAFKMIKDLDTGLWRAFRPDDPADVARSSEAKPSLPLIPSRFIKAKAYKDKKRDVLSKLILTTGWEIIFTTANSAPIQGVDLDLVLFDEEIDSETWYPEMSFRLGDRNGSFIWSATPQTGTEQLFELSERAADEAGSANPTIVEYVLTMQGNMHFPKEKYEAFVKEFINSPEDYKVRILGQFNVSSYLVYPDFNMAHYLHGCDLYNPAMPHQDQIVMDERWNYFAVIDPGFQVCAVTFFAVPPDDHPRAEQRFVFDELYIRQCSSMKFAEAMASKCAGRRFTGFLIDPSAAKMDKLGSGKSILAQYADALQARGVVSVNTGNSFEVANNDIPGGVTKVKSWLYVHPSYGRPKLQVARGRCPMFEWEMTHYRNKREKGMVLDKPNGKNDHLMDTLRYFAMYDPNWVRPPKVVFESPQYQEFKAWKKALARQEGSDGPIFFGPGSGATPVGV